tara:strand:+ start:2413 stop:3276 length:864 start_codon:yes stop_codon:yes gene_type:complete
MMNQKLVTLDFTERDLDFLTAAVVSGSSDTSTVRGAIRHDPAYRKAIVSDERVFSQVANDDESFLKISPLLYFEVLLRRAQRDLESTSYTMERSGKESIPVFDSVKVADFLDSPYVLEYLAHMLASFTRIQSYVVPVRIRKGIRRRIRYNDMDIDSLIQFASKAEESERFSFYKRIGDVCLFVTGLFRDHTYSEAEKTSVMRDPVYQVRQSSSPAWSRRIKRSVEEYEAEGKRFYKLAELHPTASMLELSDVFNVLREQFTAARKPLAFLSTHYLHSRQNNLFGITS